VPVCFRYCQIVFAREMLFDVLVIRAMLPFRANQMRDWFFFYAAPVLR